MLGKAPRNNEFWALKNISFSLERGDMLGVIGKNGAGKSTMMKAISGTLTPASGTVEKTGRICGYQLPAGMRESDKLEPPLFTPSTKAELGQHDQNISPAEAARLLGEDVARKVQETTLAIYEAGRTYAASRGIIVADTKFEFGFVDGELRLIDEVLTPDSSRFWPADQYEPGHSQPSFDKQYLRDWLSAQPWDMQPPAPALPDEVVDATARRYREAYHILTGKEFTI